MREMSRKFCLGLKFPTEKVARDLYNPARTKICGRSSVHNTPRATVIKMSDSIEYKTLARCRDKLVTSFKLDPLVIADNLVAKDLVPPTLASPTTERATLARKLIDCVFSKVEISRNHYDTFIAVISQHGWLKDIVEILASTHSKSCQAV